MGLTRVVERAFVRVGHQPPPREGMSSAQVVPHLMRKCVPQIHPTGRPPRIRTARYLPLPTLQPRGKSSDAVTGRSHYPTRALVRIPSKRGDPRVPEGEAGRASTETAYGGEADCTRGGEAVCEEVPQTGGGSMPSHPVA